MRWDTLREVNLMVVVLVGTLAVGCVGKKPGAPLASSLQAQGDMSLNAGDGEGSGILIRKAPEQPRAVAVVDFNEVPASMARAMAVTPSFETVSVYQKNRSSLSLKGDAESISAPMWMAMVTLSGNFCQDRINFEKTLPANQRLFFNAISDFSVPMSAAARNDVKERLVASILKKPMSSAISAAFDGEIESTVAAMPADKGSLVYCAGILASLGAQEK